MSRRASSPVIGLGRLVSLVVRRGDGSRQRVTPQGERWLAWDAARRDLLVLVPTAGRLASTPAASEAHELFHGAAPTSLRRMTWPSPQGRLSPLGLLESITYDATGIRSPSKGRCRWLHQFGDLGERGHAQASPDEPSPYSDQVLPRLDVDAVGNLRIFRRAGCFYTVRDWIIG